MIEPDQSELSAEGRDLLSSLREADSPSPGQLDGGLARLNASIGGPGGGGSPSAAGSSATVLKVVGGLAVAGAAIWLAATIPKWGDDSAPPDPAPAVAAPSDRGPAVPPVVESQPTVADELPVAVEAEPPAAATADPQPAQKKTKREPRSAATSPGDLEAELALLRAATAALNKGDTGQALRKADEHKRRFRQGDLAVERELLRARAQCQAGDQKAARSTARKVLKSRPGTHLADRLRQVCADE